MAQETSHKGSYLSDFYVEFLGVLVPGLFALILSVAVLATAFVVFLGALHAGNSTGMLQPSLDFVLGDYGATGALLIVAYILGSIFYRQDPKIPDWKSARKVYAGVSEIERKRLAVQPTSENTENLAQIQINDVQFPYLFLYEYLVGRGLKHLAAFVPWQGTKPETWNYRTKMFINILKIRLQFIVPDRCREIVRNEAHVRLSTSLWYATNWLLWVCAVGAAVLLLTAALTGTAALNADHTIAFAVLVAVFSIAVLVRIKIEKVIHYMRVREIVYVLETAYVALFAGHDMHLEDVYERIKRDPEN